AKQFGFCYGVERAIDMAYAARKVFPDQRLFILGEIIHNPDVNRQIAEMKITNLVGKDRRADLSVLTEEDVVIVPAFGAEVNTVEAVRELGCTIVDTTCGDVMSVWRRVKQNASEGVTSIIHGKADHEETRATASRALGRGNGHFLVVLNLEETEIVCRYIREGGDAKAFLARFDGAYSPGFDPEMHLKRIGVANQTTMLRGETEEIQRRLREAILQRDGPEEGSLNFRFFDTICGATQERQDALFEMLEEKQDLLLVVGGYNSSNTTHLAEIGSEVLPTYFILNASCIESGDIIRHYDFHQKKEVTTTGWLPSGDAVVGITAGASCPNSLIEETILRVFALRGIGREAILSA
ncbi:MAG: 4-hydroxy-3-methylbut-2-enyl diphosphate reductase, partial [Verrucomicrobiia bacterium]